MSALLDRNTVVCILLLDLAMANSRFEEYLNSSDQPFKLKASYLFSPDDEALAQMKAISKCKHLQIPGYHCTWSGSIFAFHGTREIEIPFRNKIEGKQCGSRENSTKSVYGPGLSARSERTNEFYSCSR
ncbi:hypothetical protein OROGR_030798 [Orobanche gracilis]